MSLFYASLPSTCLPLPTLLCLFLLLCLGTPERQFQRLWGRQGCLMMQHGFSCCASILVVPATLSFNTDREVPLPCGSLVIFNWHNYFFFLDAEHFAFGWWRFFSSFYSCPLCISECSPVCRRAL